jgi:hypothetical protein
MGKAMFTLAEIHFDDDAIKSGDDGDILLLNLIKV